MVQALAVAATLGCSGAPADVRSAVDVLDAATMDATMDAPEKHTRDAASDLPRDAASDIPSDISTDLSGDIPSDIPTDTPRDIPTDIPTDIPGDIARDVTADTGSEVITDVPSDVPRVDPLAALASCFDTSAPLTTARALPYLSIPIGAQRGDFLIDYGSSFSSIDLRAFAPPGPTTSGCDPTRLGVTCTVRDFSFFATPSAVSLVTQDFSGIAGPPRQAGILGTDFTSLRLTALSYAHGRMYVGGAAPCAETSWRAAGFVPLSTTGFFVRDLSALSPMRAVDALAPADARVPNIPTVPVRVGGARAVAQLDTGFDDAVVTHSVNINEAFFAAIVAADPGALVRSASRDLVLTTCVVGLSERVEAYTLGTGRAFELLTDGGAVARRTPDATVFVKRTPAGARVCGGIGTWTAAAAQVAASFFVEMGAIGFDPAAARVWVPTR